jgi:hypothetical protein
MAIASGGGLADRPEVQELFAALRRAVEHTRGAAPETRRHVAESAQRVEEELQRDRPNRTVLEGLLGTVERALRSVDGLVQVADHVKSIALKVLPLIL